MCGIAGFLDKTFRNPMETHHSTAGRMGDAIRHRGPDDAGTWVDTSAGIALAHRRLSILELSPAGHQPMLSGSGRYVIVFNGEIYNFQELRKELEKSNNAPLHFRGHSDTEVLLACFDNWNVEPTLSRVNGMFAFALWDRQERVLYLGRDRLGEKPLYYGWMGGVFLFGSELKALRAHPSFEADIDRGALALCLRHGCIPAPHSIFRGVQKLLPGTFLAVTSAPLANPAPVPFWSLRRIAEDGVADPFRGSEREAVEQLETLLRDAVRMRMLSDVPLGAFLSGGVDSSLVTSLMQAESVRPIKTFSIGFSEAEYDEAGNAARIARYLGTEHTELRVTPRDAMAVIPSLPAIYDEPFADSSQIPTFLLCRMARQHVTVGLSGDGGDEVFCGYTRHVWSDSLWKFIDAMPQPFRRATAAACLSMSPEVWDSLFRFFYPFLPSVMKHRLPGQKLHKLARLLALGNLESVYQTLVSHWNDPAEIVIGAEEPPTAITAPGDWAKRLPFTQRMMFLDAATFLPDDMLTKADRASMAVSLEMRIPLLDHRVVEFAWRLPMSMKLRGHQGKWILRELLSRYVPRPLVARPKSGFSIPLDRWLRGPLRDWAESLLAERRLRENGFFQVRPIREKWAEHLSGKSAWQHHLWDILMFQAWWDANCQPPLAAASRGSGACSFPMEVFPGSSDAVFARKEACIQTLAPANVSPETPATVKDRQKDPFDVCGVRQKASWKILFLVTEDFSFWARRRPLARQAESEGAEVWVMTCPGPYAEKLKHEGFRVIQWRVSRASLNPLRELHAFLQVLKAYRSLQPDLVHHFALKPAVYGGLAARMCKEVSCVHSIVGLGPVFTSQHWTMRCVRGLLVPLLRTALKRNPSTSIFQNQDNLDDLVRREAIRADQAVLIRGSGVNTAQFVPRPEPDGVPVVILPGRMVWEKGVREFVAAADRLRAQGVSARFVLAGEPDPDHTTSIPRAQLREWDESGVVEWWGQQDNMPEVFARSNLVCLPSHGEGVPKALIEAASSGRAIVASDVPGCREVVRHGENGLLVPAHDSAALAGALATLLQDASLRVRMGSRGREIALREFAEELVLTQVLAVYRDLLGHRWPDGAQARSGGPQECPAVSRSAF